MQFNAWRVPDSKFKVKAQRGRAENCGFVRHLWLFVAINLFCVFGLSSAVKSLLIDEEQLAVT